MCKQPETSIPGSIFRGKKGRKWRISRQMRHFCARPAPEPDQCATGENTKKSSASAQWNRRLEAGKRPFFVIKSRNFVRWRVVKLLRFWTFLIFSIPKNYAPPSSQRLFFSKKRRIPQTPKVKADHTRQRGYFNFLEKN